MKYVIIFSSYFKDNDKFGQRMLEKMGWKKGQGLGSRNQGIHESVKCRLKFDSKGNYLYFAK